ncbi:MAG TPA: DUF1573 domain-containing protein [Bacteroidales bacterium]|nr:DUF1573 domain-containing protein [Bacteroidales bacterium]
MLVAQPMPALRFQPASISFDTIAEANGPVRCRFIVHSEGTSPLRLIAVKPGCGCTTADWTQSPIAPGDSGFIEAVYDPAGRPGEFFKTIYVETNDPGHLQSYLSISGYVVPRPLTVEERYPGKQGNLRFNRVHVAMGDMYNHEKRSDTLKVFNAGNEDLALKKSGIGWQAWYRLTLIPKKLSPGEEGSLIIEYDAARRKDWGLLYDEIRFSTAEQPDSAKSFTVGVNILEDFSGWDPERRKAAPRARIDRSEIRFGSLRQGEVFSDSINLYNDGSEPLFIRKVTSSCDCLTWDFDGVTLDPGKQLSIRVRFNTYDQLGRQHKVLTIITNSPDSQVIRLSLTGTVG